MTQKKIIQAYLKDLNDWKLEYEIRCMDTPYGFIGARGDRTVRDMVAAKELEASFRGKYRIVRAKREVSPDELAKEINEKQNNKTTEGSGQTMAVKMPSPFKAVPSMPKTDAGMPSLFPEEHSLGVKV